MPSTSYVLHGVAIFECAPDGDQLHGDRDAVELVGEALRHGASLVLIPTARFDDDFFRLRTRIAGEIIQKFLTYGLRLAIAGDISHYMSESSALRDFVYESNRGAHLWFVADRDELDRRLSREAGTSS